MVKNNQNLRLELNLHAAGSCYNKRFGDNGIQSNKNPSIPFHGRPKKVA